jgi:PIN domain nuclease of toxin-antitoxin system
MMVIDASALLALLFREPGAEVVKVELPFGFVSAVNVSEVLARLSWANYPLDPFIRTLTAAEVTIVPFDLEQARAAASLVGATRPAGLGLGDRACLALALTRSMPALTADRAWASLSVGVDVQTIR